MMGARQKPKILFVTYGGGHVAIVIPIVRHLRESNLAEPVVFALTIAGAACDRAGIPHIGFKDFIGANHEAIQVGEHLTKGSVTHPDVKLEESIAYHGLSYLDLVHQVGEREAAQRFSENGRAAFRPVSFFKSVIDEIQPDLVVATNSPRSERAAIQAATELGVASCCVLDAFGVQEEWVMEPGFADRLCVLSESVRRVALDRGRRENEVIVTGNPAFDQLTHVRAKRAAANKSDTFRVLWASHPEPARHPSDRSRLGNPELQGAIANQLRSCALEHPEWDIVVRPHPTEANLTIEGPPNLTVIGNDELADRLAWADVVVTVASTVGIEAAIAGVPVIAVQGSVISSDVPLAAYGLAQAVEVDELGALLHSIQRKPPSAEISVADPGGATGRVIEVLLDLCPDPEAGSWPNARCR